MSADYMVRSVVGHVARHGGTPVTTLNAVAGIAEAAHQRDESSGHTVGAPTTRCRCAGEPKAWKRGNYIVKRRRVKLSRFGERLDQVQELNDRSGPAVNQHQ